ncbi:MAG: hypothetical protein IID39_05425, partial [Planctomycetes bacterium]|nr:hypothetical protein [Planctomycetota bacterium]
MIDRNPRRKVAMILEQRAAWARRSRGRVRTGALLVAFTAITAMAPRADADVNVSFGDCGIASCLTVEVTAGEDVAVFCKGGSVFVNSTQYPGIQCSSVQVFNIVGDGASNTIDLSGVGLEFSSLAFTQVFGNGGDDIIIGTDLVSVFDLLAGGEGNDFLLGGEGADELRGEGGDDILNGEGGNDTLIGGAGNDLYRYLADGGGKDHITEALSDGDNDRATFVSDEPGVYTISPTGVRRGADELVIHVLGACENDPKQSCTSARNCGPGNACLPFGQCVGGENDGEGCLEQAACRSIDRVTPNDGVCTWGLERLTILGDSPIKADDNDTYNVAPSRSMIITISDLGPSSGDVINYDHRQNQPACPIDDGESISTEGGVRTVFYSGIETVNVAVADCQNATCSGGNNSGADCFGDDDCDGGTCSAEGNEVEDGCELLDGSEFDCGGEGIPDVCQRVDDCNNNGILDTVPNPASDDQTAVTTGYQTSNTCNENTPEIIIEAGILNGGNGVADTTAILDDVQVVAVGNSVSTNGGVIISAGPNGIIDTV